MSRVLPEQRKVEEDFRQFVTKFEKVYQTLEEADERLAVFKTNLDYIEWFNSQENSFKRQFVIFLF